MKKGVSVNGVLVIAFVPGWDDDMRGYHRIIIASRCVEIHPASKARPFFKGCSRCHV